MEAQILLHGVSFEQLQNTIQAIVSNEMQKAVELMTPQHTKETTSELLTRKQVAEYLGISLVTLNEWTKKGFIPAKRIGRTIRYEKQIVLDAFKDIRTLKYRRA